VYEIRSWEARISITRRILTRPVSSATTSLTLGSPSIAATTNTVSDRLAQTDAHTPLPPRSQHHLKVRPFGPPSRRHHVPRPSDLGQAIGSTLMRAIVGLADPSNARMLIVGAPCVPA
jgi:hypothetical protein